MSQTHLTGAIAGNRQGSAVTQQSAVFDYSSPASATPIKCFTIKASTAEPVAYRVTGVVMTASNAAVTHTVELGVDAGAGITALLNGVDAKAAINTNYVPTTPVRIAVTDVDIWFQQTISGAVTAGKFAVLVDLAEINVKAPAIGE